MTARNKKYEPGRNAGFTLLELVLATLISTLVMGILTVAFTFSLRVWERQQARQSSEIPAMMDLMKMQLVHLEITPPQPGQDFRTIFIGDPNSFSFTTGYSVKAISGGVPVIARYVYVRNEKRLYYAESPLNIYHPESIQNFLSMPIHVDEKAQPRFYSTEVADFSIEYASDESGQFLQSWEGEGGGVPHSILVRWSDREGAATSSAVMLPSSLFPPDVGDKEGRQQPGLLRRSR